MAGSHAAVREAVLQVLLTQPIADVMELLRHEEEHRSTSETYEWCQWVTREMHLNKEVCIPPALPEVRATS